MGLETAGWYEYQSHRYRDAHGLTPEAKNVPAMAESQDHSRQ